MHSFKSFDDFCQDTSLHGWAHFNQPKNSKTGRLVWFLIILASFSAAFYLTGRYVLVLSYRISNGNMLWFGCRVLNEFKNASVVWKLESPMIDVKLAEFPTVTMRNSYQVRYGYIKVKGLSHFILLQFKMVDCRCISIERFFGSWWNTKLFLC